MGVPKVTMGLSFNTILWSNDSDVFFGYPMTYIGNLQTIDLYLERIS